MSQLEHPLDGWWLGTPKELPKLLFRFLRGLKGRLVFGTFDWDPTMIGGASTADTTFTTTTSEDFAELRPGMVVFVSPPSTFADGLSVGGAWVAADGELTVRLSNVDALPTDDGSGTWSFVAFNVR